LLVNAQTKKKVGLSNVDIYAGAVDCLQGRIKLVLLQVAYFLVADEK
jgi:hypothetical protein